jgi:mannose-6-phosphate isomerase-like protein (cupin superfamily)
MSHTIKNLRDVKDSAPEFGFADTHEAHFASEDLNAVETGVSYLVVRPGKRQGVAHKHDAAEEVYVVVSGSGRIKLDEQITQVKPLDAIRVAPNVVRQFEADDEGLAVIAFGRRHDGDGDVVSDPGFWD